MRNYRYLALNHIKYNKKSVFLIISALIILIGTIISTSIIGNKIKEERISKAKVLYGDYHIKLVDLDKKQIEIIEKNINIDKVGIEKKYGSSILLDEWIITNLGMYDENCKDMLNVKLKYGRYPENTSEIVLEEWVIPYLQAKVQNDNNIYISFTNEQEKIKYITSHLPRFYRLVGVLENRIQLKSTVQTIGLISKADIIMNKGSNIKYNVYVKFKSVQDINKIIQDLNKYVGIDINKVIYNLEYIREINQSKHIEYIKLIIIILILMVIARTISIIFSYSGFNRIRQLSLLRAIGATKKQMKDIIRGEILIIGLVAIVCSLPVAVIFIEIISLILKNFESEIHVLSNINFKELGIWIIIIFVAIIFSGLTSIKRLNKKSITRLKKMQSDIVYDEDIFEFKKFKLIYKIFGISGEIAYHNMWRNKKKAVSNIFWLSMSIGVLFVINTIMYSSIPYVYENNVGKMQYILKGDSNIGFSLQRIDEINTIKGVKNIYTSQSMDVYVNLFKDKNKLNDVTINEINNFNYNSYLKVKLLGYDNKMIDMIKENLLKGNLKSLNEKKEDEIIVNKKFIDRYGKINVGEYIEIYLPNMYGSNIKYRKVRIRVGGVVSSSSSLYYNDNEPSIIINQNVFKKYINYKLYNQLNILIDNNADVKKIEQKLTQIAKELPKGNLKSCNQELIKYNNYKRKLFILMSIIIVFILMLNMLNIMSSNNVSIVLRLKEMSVFRVLGMTKKQLMKTIIFEGVFLGLISSVIGIIFGAIFIKVIIKLELVKGIYLRIPYFTTILILTLCILISIVSIRVSLRSISNKKISEMIRITK